jgi:CRISPR type I-D-associated protein Csc2
MADLKYVNLWHPDKDAFERLEPYLEPTIRPLLGLKTIQILLIREALDYLVLRTEDTREINEVVTPSRRAPEGEIRRVAFLGGKQKAVESRELERLLRSAALDAQFNRTAEQGNRECFLKDNLCLRCPRCALFGGTSTESGRGQEPNVRHRIEYASAFSLLPYEEVVEELTFNAINDDKQTTGQALGSRPCVRPGTLFASVVTLRSATPHELMVVLKVLLSARSYGAESRTAGDVRNHVVGIIGGWEEVLTPLEFTLECESRLDRLPTAAYRAGALHEMVSEYWGLCAQPSKVLFLNTTSRAEDGKLRIVGGLDTLLDAVRQFSLTKDFLERAYQDVQNLRQEQRA